MPKSYEKYVAKLPKSLRLKLGNAVENIISLRLEKLDIKKMEGYDSLFRCRVGKFRIIFEKKKDAGEILEINTRGDVY